MLDSHRKGFKRNYTELFNGYRKSLRITPRNQPDSHNNIVTALSDDINIKLSILDRKITELEELFAQRVLPTFDNSEVELCDHNIRQITNEISHRISALSSEIKHPIPTLDTEVANLLMNLQQCHKLRLASLVQKFRNIQATRRPNNQRLHRDDQNDLISDIYADFQPNLENDDQNEAILQHNMEAIQNDELQHLIVMMNELNSLFRDMSLLIFEQGTVLDRIDTKIELAVQDVERGNEQLEQANEYQSSNCFYMYITVLVGLIGVCIFIMLFRKR
ncbi:SNARE domain containing protein [Tritrichomonas foetus]|uniref:SNARE domain containing protein n=1 Tax=Tritrichomonas foetus TaxID=1144522 RepID=A0A1J4JUC7_9EUKA|nr:SNARE domain containing protein [Tritrichomonas foetus]|eukprot:OHT02080.1 SNARE domain containing protein [Tritrichomonas foetus]